MSTVDEIATLEERLHQAELAPDPAFFEEILADDLLIDGQRAKAKIVAAHQPGAGPKFTRVEMSDFEIVDHGTAAVVTCMGRYEGPQWSGTLKFMRVWLKRDGRWQIIAGTVSH
ncbi:MAG: nuclear transport factor 2 family protein [Alphaproteobacteria bacterium]|nr:nuclear transport factor 2 family protein [Alphaproteobacteria bacterium]